MQVGLGAVSKLWSKPMSPVGTFLTPGSCLQLLLTPLGFPTALR
ncbi:rCG49804 [Rattus norvegicus]|uniref:RCG49804 n=1 Tax=Rattus norvegicus TaxID=10116 RepID=A6K4I2_RAT|nr:rCG49804 [Rattus norvegicus]